MREVSPRLHVRLDAYSQAIASLGDALTVTQVRAFTELEGEGIVRRFGQALELAWKVMQDDLDAQGVAPAIVTPASVIKASVAAGLIEDGDLWTRALDARKLASYCFDRWIVERTIKDIRTKYLALLTRLQQRTRDQIEAANEPR